MVYLDFVVDVINLTTDNNAFVWFGFCVFVFSGQLERVPSCARFSSLVGRGLVRQPHKQTTTMQTSTLLT